MTGHAPCAVLSSPGEIVKNRHQQIFIAKATAKKESHGVCHGTPNAALHSHTKHLFPFSQTQISLTPPKAGKAKKERKAD
jgi:hypothetical protein